MNNIVFFIKTSILSSLLSSIITTPLFVFGTYDANIDIEPFISMMLPVFIPSFAVILVFTILFAVPTHILLNRNNNFNIKNMMLIGALTALTIDLFYIVFGIINYPLFSFFGIIHSWIYWTIAKRK
ncbi:hypothetical protein [Bathymodiolus heckerae thiotrophic gill symbiont]|uniref:hypothetical protein n=1 Tax=Bathymodiolus heckerae thiotrophic gill symbiont TaxID=1052212 RepID=UPI0010FE1F89|nr:hypothetical protein [Bathymodiolus heckerae thiotrophic gill symbiont]